MTPIILNLDPELSGSRLRLYPRYAASLTSLDSVPLTPDSANTLHIYRALGDAQDIENWPSTAVIKVSAVSGATVTTLLTSSALTATSNYYTLDLTSVDLSTYAGQTLYFSLTTNGQTYYFTGTVAAVSASVTRPVLTTQPVRLAFNAEQIPGSALDVNTNASPVIWRGTDVSFQIGLFYDGLPIDVSAYNALKLEVKPNTVDGRVGSALMSKTVSSPDNTLTKENWAAGTAQNGVFTFSNTETLLDLGGQQSATFWLVVSATTSGGNTVTLGSATLTIYEDGAGLGGPAPSQIDAYYTKTDADALLAAKLSAALSNLRATTDQRAVVYCPDTGKWHALYVALQNGIPALALDPTQITL